MQNSARAQSSQEHVAHVFRIRSRVIAGFALILPLITELGDGRFLVVGAIALVVLPYNMILERQTQRVGEVPAFVPWADQVLSIGATSFVDTLWAPVLMVMVATLALAATLFDSRRVFGPTVVGLALASLVGFQTQTNAVALAGIPKGGLYGSG